MIADEYNFKEQLKYFASYSCEEINADVARPLIFWGNYQTEEYLSLFAKKYLLHKYLGNHENETVKNLLRWTFEILLHSDYIEDMIEYRNSIEMIEFSKRKKSCLNCFCHSYILRDALQSLGITCRLVYCLPLDCSFYGNHVVIEYYDAAIQKWCVVDPTYNMFFLNNQGQPLSLLEVRENIILENDFNIVDNNRFKTVCNSHASLTDGKNTYLEEMTRILLVLQYENVSEYGHVSYRLLPERYLVPCPNNDSNQVRYIYNPKLLY